MIEFTEEAPDDEIRAAWLGTWLELRADDPATVSRRPNSKLCNNAHAPLMPESSARDALNSARSGNSSGVSPGLSTRLDWQAARKPNRSVAGVQRPRPKPQTTPATTPWRYQATDSGPVFSTSGPTEKPPQDW